MKVDGYGNIKNNSSVKKRAGVSGSSFSDALSAAEGEDTPQAAQAGNVAAPSLTNILVLQEVSDEDARRQKQVQQGHNILDSLEDLRRRLLLGSLPLSTLQNIGAQLATARENISDPRLMMLMDDIELRAAVELAKLEMAIAAQSKIE